MSQRQIRSLQMTYALTCIAKTRALRPAERKNTPWMISAVNFAAALGIGLWVELERERLVHAILP